MAGWRFRAAEVGGLFGLVMLCLSGSLAGCGGGDTESLDAADEADVGGDRADDAEETDLGRDRADDAEAADAVEGDAHTDADDGTEVGCEDGDGDGYGRGPDCLGADCDDSDPGNFPGNDEICDGADNNCDGVVDTDAIDRVALYVDADGDGHGDPGSSALVCPASGYAENGDDCDDSAILCAIDCTTDDNDNGVRDCDEDCTDADRDGYGTGADCRGADCDDGNPAVNPSAGDEPNAATLADPIVDSNCDGYDGVHDPARADRDEYILAGSSNAQVQAAIDNCASRPGCDVLLEVGSYDIDAAITLHEGTRLFGGYRGDADLTGDGGADPFSARYYGEADAGWPPGTGEFGTTESDATRFVGGATTSDGVVLADALISLAVLDGIWIVGADAGATGASSYAVRVRGSNAEFRRSHIESGDGADGAPAGTAAAGLNGSESGTVGYCGAWGGRRGFIGSTYCTSPYQDLVAARDGTAGGDPVAGGAGGAGGAVYFESHCDEADCGGSGGGSLSGRHGGHGSCGGGGSASADVTGALSAGSWVSLGQGRSGARGFHGTGGGGGGAGGSSVCENRGGIFCGGESCNGGDGGDGGTGGPGGCGGSGADGGLGGGAAVALLVDGSVVTLTEMRVTLGQGGDGGSGGMGGAGGDGYGGTANTPGECSGENCGAPGASGGYGGGGGGGGGGAGGAGGPAFGIVHAGTAPSLDAVNFHGGSGGVGGTGGTGGLGGAYGLPSCSGTRGDTGGSGPVQNVQSF